MPLCSGLYGTKPQQNLQAEGISVLNWATSSVGLKPEFFLDNIHFNATGSKIIADNLAKFLREDESFRVLVTVSP